MPPLAPVTRATRPASGEPEGLKVRPRCSDPRERRSDVAASTGPAAGSRSVRSGTLPSPIAEASVRQGRPARVVRKRSRNSSRAASWKKRAKPERKPGTARPVSSHGWTTRSGRPPRRSWRRAAPRIQRRRRRPAAPAAGRKPQRPAPGQGRDLQQRQASRPDQAHGAIRIGRRSRARRGDERAVVAEARLRRRSASGDCRSRAATTRGRGSPAPPPRPPPRAPPWRARSRPGSARDRGCWRASGETNGRRSRAPPPRAPASGGRAGRRPRRGRRRSPSRRCGRTPRRPAAAASRAPRAAGDAPPGRRTPGTQQLWYHSSTSTESAGSETADERLGAQEMPSSTLNWMAARAIRRVSIRGRKWLSSSL